MVSQPSSPARLLQLRMWNFRAYRWAYLPFADLTVLIGPNAAGKSTIAQALWLISQALREGLETALVQSDGAMSLVSRPSDKGERRLGLAIKLQCGGIDWLYGFVLRFRGESDYFIHEERLTPLDSGSKGVMAAGHRRQAVGFWRDSRGRIKPVSGQEVGDKLLERPIAPSLPPSLALPLISARWEVWQQILDVLRRMRTYQLIPEQIRLPHPAGSTTAALTRDGGNAADVVQQLRSTPVHRWIVEHLAHTTKGLEDVLVETTMSVRGLGIQQRINGHLERFSGHALSEGTMRMLGALLALRQDPRPSLVFLDEMDADLHPPALDVLLGAIDSCLDETQVIVASHNPEALSNSLVTPERVRLLRWSDGVSTIHPVHDAVNRLFTPPETIGRLLSINALEPAEGGYALPGEDYLDRQRNLLEIG